MPIKTPLLTLCITTLNRINLLRETLDSIIIQNNNEIEVVITDGGSIDDTRSVLQEYANKYGYINFINTNKKLGKSLIAYQDINQGEVFTLNNLSGRIFKDQIIPVRESNKLIGKISKRNLKKGDIITYDDF